MQLKQDFISVTFFRVPTFYSDVDLFVSQSGHSAASPQGVRRIYIHADHDRAPARAPDRDRNPDRDHDRDPDQSK